VWIGLDARKRQRGTQSEHASPYSQSKNCWFLSERGRCIPRGGAGAVCVCVAEQPEGFVLLEWPQGELQGLFGFMYVIQLCYLFVALLCIIELRCSIT
jgi:hypothetical protein